MNKIIKITALTFVSMVASAQAAVVYLADNAIAPNANPGRPFTKTIGGVFNGNTITSGVTTI